MKGDTMTRTFLALGILPLLLLHGGPPGGETQHATAGAASDLMEAKTMHAQNIFRHLAEADLGKVRDEAAELEHITLEAGFDTQSGTYEEYGEHFLRIVRALKTEAEQGSLAGSYYEFSRMTGVCFACHDHLRDSAD